MVRLYFLSTIILLFILSPRTVIADLKGEDLIAKFDKAASNIIKFISLDIKAKGTHPLLFYAPYRNWKQAVYPV